MAREVIITKTDGTLRRGLLFSTEREAKAYCNRKTLSTISVIATVLTSALTIIVWYKKTN